MMKKNVFFYGALALGMAGSLASCSSDDDLMAGSVPGGNTAAAGQVIEIAVENAGNGIGSRAGRPLNSSEAKQNIDCVKVIVTKASNNEVVADTLIANWMTSTAVTNYDDASGHGRKIRFTLANSNAITAKDTYTVYAIGYNQNSAYGVKSGSSTMSLGSYLNSVGNGKKSMSAGSNGYTVEDAGNESIKKFTKDLVLINQNTDHAYADEVFAGSTTLDLTSDTKFSQGVTLHRQVAGIFTYVKNVPFMYTTNGNTITDKGNILQLVAVKKNKSLVLGQFYNTTLGNNGESNILQNVVNGAEEDNKEYVVYEIKLDDWFKTLQDENNDGVIDRYEYMIATADDAEGKYHKGDLIEDKSDDHLLWRAPLRADGERFHNVGFVKGSVFGGEFIIPFKATTTGDYTFELRLVSKENDGTIKQTYRTWSISLPSDDILEKTDQWSYWDGSKFTDLANLTADETRAKYSVLRNHLYGVGVKSKEKPNTGDPSDPDPDDPDPDDPDPEDPEDLNTKQDLLVQVNDNWELIHKMEVE